LVLSVALYGMGIHEWLVMFCLLHRGEVSLGNKFSELLSKYFNDFTLYFDCNARGLKYHFPFMFLQLNPNEVKAMVGNGLIFEVCWMNSDTK